MDEYFSDRFFKDLPAVQNFVSRVRRSVENPLKANEIASELVDQGYITALKRLGYRDAPKDVAFSKSMVLEESCVITSIPRRVVKQALSIFSSAKVP